MLSCCSYETFRLHAPRLTSPGSCDLLICDEAHRLKNDATLTNRYDTTAAAIAALLLLLLALALQHHAALHVSCFLADLACMMFLYSCCL
jgi:hypothetical protein